MIEVLSSPAGKALFSTASDGLRPPFSKYTTPISRLRYSDSVWNVRSKGIPAVWKIANQNNVYSTSYSGRVPFIKFYYGNGVPETILGINLNQRWSVDYNLFFYPPVNGPYNFYFGGSGHLSSAAIQHFSGLATTSAFLSFDSLNYTSVKALTMTGGSKYRVRVHYKNLKDRESGLVMLWNIGGNATAFPEKVAMSGAVCSPTITTDSGFPIFDRISSYRNVSFQEEESGASSLKFQVPFVDSTQSYNYSGFYYDKDSDSFIDKYNGVQLKKYRYIRYDTGFKTTDNKEEYLTKFTGQIRNFHVNYNNDGNDTLEVTCYDHSVFTKDHINLVSPTPVDYWQVGYLDNIPGKVNGLVKPRAFDGWELHKAYEILLTESFIDPYSFYKRKHFRNYLDLSTPGTFHIESLGSRFKDFLSVQQEYGIPSIGEVENNQDAEYAYSINTGEFYRDFIDEITKNWYYKWGMNSSGHPFLRRINAPYSYANTSTASGDFNSTNWHKETGIYSFKGNYIQTQTANAIASVDAIGKKLVLLVGNNALTGTSLATHSNLRVTIRRGGTFVSSASYNTWTSTAHYYNNGPNNVTGVNSSIINIANGLPYDQYRVVCHNLIYRSRIEGLLSYNEDYEVPVATFYTGGSTASVGELDINQDLESHRTSAIVLGRRTGTQVKLDSAGNEVAVNPNNQVFTYIQSAARDLDSIYLSSVSNYIGRPRTTVVIDPSITSQNQADYIAFNIIKEYGTPKKSPAFTIQSNPHLQVDDCICVVDSHKKTSISTDYAWITSIDSSLDDLYLDKINTTFVKPVDSYWQQPDLDPNDYDGHYIYNLKVINRGYSTELSKGISSADSGVSAQMFLVKHHSNLINLIPKFGYCRIRDEVIKYDSADFSASTIRLKGLTRNLGEGYFRNSSLHNYYLYHSTNSHVIIAHNPYSLSQSPPIVSFDLLVNANVETTIWNYVPPSPFYGNLNKDFGTVKIDALTNINGNLNDFNFTFLNKGHYEFIWGGLDRRGEYNNLVKSPEEPSLLNSQFYARENFNVADIVPNPSIPYKYSTGCGRFYSRIRVTPESNPNITKEYLTVDTGTFISDYGKEAGSIKQILMDAGVVDLKFDTNEMFYIRPNSIKINSNPFTRVYSFERPNRQSGGLFSQVSQATNYPLTKPNSTVLPVFILNRSNSDQFGNSKGFIFQVDNYSPNTNFDIIRNYTPTIKYHIHQFGWWQSETGGIPYVYPNPIITSGTLSDENISQIVLGNQYYLNPKKVLFNSDTLFIPEDWRYDFLNNTKNPNHIMEITNCIFFEHSMVDLSGRKPKQIRRYIPINEFNQVFFEFDSANFGSMILAPKALHLLTDLGRNNNANYLPYKMNTATSNRGFYEFINQLDSDSWQYRHFSNFGLALPQVHNQSFAYRKDIKSEFKQFRGMGIFSEETYEDTKNDYFSWQSYNVHSTTYPWNRNNYITWMDEDIVKEIVFYDLLHLQGGRWITAKNHPGRHFNDHFVPNIWSRFKRSDF